MACTVTLPFWPSALDCVHWSADNHLAVVGGDSVAILIPRLHAARAPFWHTLLVQINAFSAAELPLREPMPDKHFLVGEEVATCQAQAARWSPPGLAQLGGCALAVLTSNRVLSIWAPCGRADDARGWKRRAIVNRALQRHYERQAAPGADVGETTRVQQRVLAFAWSPALHSPPERDNKHLFPGRCFIAVATEAGHILLLRVASPHSGDGGGTGGDWTVELTDCIQVGRPASHMVWSSWRADHGSGASIATLAYIAGGQLFSLPLVAAPGGHAVTASANPTPLLERTDITGPLRSRGEAIVAFAPDRVYHLSPARQAWSHHLDRRWDPIAGATFVNNALHVVSHMSSATSPTAVVPVSGRSEGLAASDGPRWQHAMIAQKTAYAAEKSLATQAQERTFGIASSPVGIYVATCVSMHPADAIAYVISSDQVSMLNITSEVPDDESSNLATAAAEVMDVMYFYLRHVRSAGRELSTPQLCHTTPYTASLSSIEHLVPRLRVAVYSTALRQAQLRAIMARLDGQSSHTADSTKLVIRHVATPFLALPTAGLHCDQLSLDIRAIYDVALSKIEAGHALGDIITSAKAWSEACAICHQPIALESFHWARCTRGHQFGRCALSLLSIQEPGSTKHCGVCARQYLDETRSPHFGPHRAKRGAGVDAPANDTCVKVPHAGEGTEITLARVLFAACNVCVYCGGRFTF